MSSHRSPQVPQLADSYWDPHLSRCNLAEPCFGNILEDCGLSLQLGAGRAIVTADDDEEVRRYILEKVRVRGERTFLELGRADADPKARRLRAGQPVHLSWTHNEAWWGANVHVAVVQSHSLIVDLPRTAFRFPIRSRLLDEVSNVARMFDSFDVTLFDTSEMTAVTHPGRVTELVGGAIDQSRPALMFLHNAGTFFAGRLVATPGAAVRWSARPPNTFELSLVGTDMVGVLWRPGVSVALTCLVNGLTVAFRTQIAGGQGPTVEMSWPENVFRRQRRQHYRVAVGSREIVEFRLPIQGASGPVKAAVKPFRVVDIGPRGAGLVVENDASAQLPDLIADAECELYGRTKIKLTVEVLSRMPFGEKYTRLCCAFRGLELRHERALEIVCTKLQAAEQ